MRSKKIVQSKVHGVLPKVYEKVKRQVKNVKGQHKWSRPILDLHKSNESEIKSFSQI